MTHNPIMSGLLNAKPAKAKDQIKESNDHSRDTSTFLGPHKKLNGYSVIAYKPAINTQRQYNVVTKKFKTIKDQGQVVLVNTWDNELHPYVVASYYDYLGSTWMQGDYCKTKEEALEVFNNRKN